MGQLFKLTKIDFISCAKFTGIFCLIGIFAEKLFRYSCSITFGYFISLLLLSIFSKAKKMKKQENTSSIYFCRLINISCLFIAIIDIAYIYLLISFQKYQCINMILHYQWKQFILGVLLSLIPFYNIYIKGLKKGDSDNYNIYTTNKNNTNKYEAIFNNARENNKNYSNQKAEDNKSIINKNNNRNNNRNQDTQENSRTNRDIKL